MLQTLLTELPEKRLSARTLSCLRGGRMVFANLSFELGAGEYLHLAGSNGSGKSTLLRLLAGLLSAYSGNVLYGDEDMAGAEAARMGVTTYSGHQHGLKPVLSLRENCSHFVRLMTGDKLLDSRMEEAALGLGLEALVDMPVRFFSSGQTHRAALLRFLLIKRPLWLMDEPTVGLDSDNRSRLQGLMQAHLDGGGMIVAASHDPIALAGKTLNMADYAANHEHLEHWL